MTSKQQRAMEMALEWLEKGNFVYPSRIGDALREALAEQPLTTELPAPDHKFVDLEGEAPDIHVWNQSSLEAYARTAVAAELERIRALQQSHVIPIGQRSSTLTPLTADQIDAANALFRQDMAPLSDGRSRMTMVEVCELIPEGVFWGDRLTPQIAREIVGAAVAAERERWTAWCNAEITRNRTKVEITGSQRHRGAADALEKAVRNYGDG